MPKQPSKKTTPKDQTVVTPPARSKLEEAILAVASEPDYTFV